ncbi:MAG: SPOR domain-containing protein [Parashewanella sp.]
MGDLVLLPSQQQLIERLEHNAFYGQQVQLLCGESGSGKTLLLHYVATQLKDYQQVVIPCPLHADDAEIRRKVWVPLLKDPVFDDEIPLADTLLSIGKNIEKPIALFFDDAHRLSIHMWAEVLSMSQMISASKPVAVIVSVTPEYAAELLEQLPEPYAEQLLLLQIEALTFQEQDALFLTMMSQSSDQLIAGRKIARPDFSTQACYPADIVSLFYTDDEKAEKKSKINPKIVTLTVIALVMIAAIFGWLFTQYQTKQEQLKSTFSARAKQQQLTVVSPANISAETLPAKLPMMEVSESSADNYPAHVDKQRAPIETVVTKPQSEDIDAILPATTVKSQATESNKVVTIETEEVKDTSKLAEVKDVSKLQSVKNQNSNLDKVKGQPRIKFPKGYTLQIATVTQRRSLQNLLSQLDGQPDVKIAKNNDRWIVIVGDFANRQQALNFERKLLKTTTVSKPWLRKWESIKQFSFQSNIP